MTIRAAGYSIKEDIRLCQIYVEISEDPITGVQQTGDHFWGRVEESYNNAKEELWGYRNKRSLHSRIQVIERAVRKLNGCIRQLENLHPKKDIIMQAKCLLMQDPNYKKGFKFDHLWEMMKDFAKFKDIDVGKKKVRNEGSFCISSESEAPSPDSPIISSPNLSIFSLNLNADITGNSTSSQRPSGVKKAKMKRKVYEGFSSALKSVELQNDRLAEMLANSNSEKKLDRELKDRALKLNEFKEENKIILMNADGIVDPNVREFVRQEQSRIMEKRSQQYQQPQPQP
ncbi:hypothetical protein R3W88_002657 [Solanum pinnatisectum]|uniref:No apical meristem-associated C-terminal domain-containing protein n=1 Tax=Solanum pinnatisectum TaxID=50273 RepID=A0AAV9MPI0_9SOLN|nr:hypothetical protein R3W88_002657 [Solanum pinnatisectum]